MKTFLLFLAMTCTPVALVLAWAWADEWLADRADRRRRVEPEPPRPDLPRRHVLEITTAEWIRISTEDGWAKTIAEIDALPEVSR